VPSLRAGFGAAIQELQGLRWSFWIATPQARLAMTARFNRSDARVDDMKLSWPETRSIWHFCRLLLSHINLGDAGSIGNLPQPIIPAFASQALFPRV